MAYEGIDVETTNIPSRDKSRLSRLRDISSYVADNIKQGVEADRSTKEAKQAELSEIADIKEKTYQIHKKRKDEQDRKIAIAQAEIEGAYEAETPLTKRIKDRLTGNRPVDKIRIKSVKLPGESPLRSSKRRSSGDQVGDMPAESIGVKTKELESGAVIEYESTSKERVAKKAAREIKIKKVKDRLGKLTKNAEHNLGHVGEDLKDIGYEAAYHLDKYTNRLDRKYRYRPKYLDKLDYKYGRKHRHYGKYDYLLYDQASDDKRAIRQPRQTFTTHREPIPKHQTTATLKGIPKAISFGGPKDVQIGRSKQPIEFAHRQGTPGVRRTTPSMPVTIFAKKGGTRFGTRPSKATTKRLETR